ncbi:hypothetical protein BRD17_04365, partial [Halobacteriales archaeon SW_7_68_16]
MIAIALAIGLVVIATAAVGIYVFVFDTADGAPQVALRADTNGSVTYLQHRGGQELPMENVEVIMRSDGTSRRL